MPLVRENSLTRPRMGMSYCSFRVVPIYWPPMGRGTIAEIVAAVAAVIGVAVAVFFSALSVAAADKATIAAEGANARADAANELAYQALALQKNQFLADTSSDAGKVSAQYELRDANTTSQRPVLAITVANTSTRPMDSVTLTFSPCRKGPAGRDFTCNSEDKKWLTQLGSLPACTTSVFQVLGKDVSNFSDEVNAAVTWKDAAGSTWRLDSGATTPVLTTAPNPFGFDDPVIELKVLPFERALHEPDDQIRLGGVGSRALTQGC